MGSIRMRRCRGGALALPVLLLAACATAPVPVPAPHGDVRLESVRPPDADASPMPANEDMAGGAAVAASTLLPGLLFHTLHRPAVTVPIAADGHRAAA